MAKGKEPFVQMIGLEKLKKNLSFAEQDAFPKAAAAAINRTAKTVQSRTVKAVAKKMGVRQKDVRDGADIRKAHADRLYAKLLFRGDAFNLIRFKARQIKKGVSAAPWGNRRHFAGAFIANINGADVVLIRKKGVGRVGEGETQESRRAAAIAAATGSGHRDKRLPVRAMKGPGVAKTAAEDDVAKEREEVMKERLPIEFKRSLEYYTKRFSG